MKRRGLLGWLGLATVGLAGALVAACSPLSAFNALVPKDEAGAITRNVAYGSLPRQRLDIYAPPGGSTRAPVLVFVHGGSWATGSKNGYGWAARALAARGYLAILPDYRLVPEGRYPAFVEDVALAIAWAHANASEFGGDPDRLAVAGHSAGAYNGLQAVLAPEFLQAAGTDPAVVDALVNLSGPTDFLPLDTKASINAFGHLGEDALAATQPVNRLGSNAPPILTVHGTADTTVEPRHARALDRVAGERGVRHELHLLEGVNHRDVVLGLSRPFRDRVPTLDLIDAFLRDVLGNEAPAGRS